MSKKTDNRLVNLTEDVADKAREVWLAGLGALSAVESEGPKVFSKETYDGLVERGSKFERARQEQLAGALSQAAAKPMELAAKPMELASNVQDSFTSRLEEVFETALDRFGVPTRKEVRDLTKMVETLTAKVDALATALDAAEEVTVYEVRAHENGWAVQREGAERAASVHATKDEALEAGREVAKNAEPAKLLVFKKDGVLQDTVTYGIQ